MNLILVVSQPYVGTLSIAMLAMSAKQCILTEPKSLGL